MKFDPNFWIELEQNYFETMKKRQQLLAKYGTKVLNFTRESEQACRELMEMVVQFLCIRYPQYFQLEAGNTKLHNRLLSTVSDLEATPPLRVVFDNVPEDFAIVVRDDDTGYYHLRAGSICSTLGWNLHTKMNKSLAEIHEPVADFKEKMLKSVDRYELPVAFRLLPPFPSPLPPPLSSFPFMIFLSFPGFLLSFQGRRTNPLMAL